jgi:hypothetical protein
MRLTAVWGDAVLDHRPAAEIWVGARTPGTEVPPRAIVLRDAVVAAGARLVPVVAGHEGGYHPPSLGTLAVAALSGLVDGGTG